jgi:hypothetical protein
LSRAPRKCHTSVKSLAQSRMKSVQVGIISVCISTSFRGCYRIRDSRAIIYEMNEDAASDYAPDSRGEKCHGHRSQNEQGTRLTCLILMQKLNALAGNRDRLEYPVHGPEKGFDGRLYSHSEEKRSLEIQVTKASPRIWHQLVRSSSGVKSERSFEDVCTSLRQAIEKKKSRSDPKMILALEAVHCPVPQLIADHFVKNHKEAAQSAGFKRSGWSVQPSR